MKIEELKEYIHNDWSETAECRNDKYYFVRTDADELEDVFAEIKYQMSEEVPDDFIMYRENAWNNMDENKLLAFLFRHTMSFRSPY